MKQTDPRLQTPYGKRLFWRKARMYLMWALTFIACLIVSLSAFNQRFFETADPQIKSAYTQIARLMPTLEANEASLLKTYEVLVKSREKAAKMGITLSKDTIADSRSAKYILDSSLSMDRITRLTVGRKGGVAIAMKDTGEIVAHPNEGEIGKTLMISRINSKDLISTEGGGLATSVANFESVPDLYLIRFTNEKDVRNMQLRHLIFLSGDGGRVRLSSALSNMFFGSIVPYGPFYIVCGIDMLDYLLFMSWAVFISVIACAILWLFVHYISLMLDRHELNGRDLRRQLIAYTLLLTIGIFGLSWYVQVLNIVTNELNAIESYADSGVTTLKSFQDTEQRFNNWFDEQYLTQCRIARDYVKSKGKENITRGDLASLRGTLGVKYIYVYDRSGKVFVTNSPYDHLKLSDDPADPSHAFLPLLEGADHVIQPPMPDEISGDRVQLIGVSLRDEADMSDGFVQVCVDPRLRDYLTQPLSVNSVLTDMIVGLPTDAIALDKTYLSIVATTGFGYVGESIENFGYNAEKLKTNRNGFLQHGGKHYYAGFGESEKHYLIPVAERTSDIKSFMISLYIAMVALVGQALILLMALFHYQKSVVDDAPPQEATAEDGAQEPASPANPPSQFTGIPGIVRVQEKSGFEERWHIKTDKSEQTPGERVRAIAYKLVLVLCVWNLLLVIYSDLSGARLTGLSYVLSRNWEKGVNIFAFTSCLYLLFALYVFVSLSNRVLYNIARISACERRRYACCCAAPSSTCASSRSSTTACPSSAYPPRRCWPPPASSPWRSP